ncbi:MAG: PEFG-CTERM sorting domain-containing protein, partial [Candidatus Nitrosotalea sp.]|nr:PEFG-CTERM sorting domain-containing protein [Candidatus Nitrosotalea sp.]
MSTHKEYALIAILVTAAVIGIIPVFAQSAVDTSSSQNSPGTGSQQILPIAVSTDKDVYDRQSIVIVTGHVQNSIAGQAVTMKVSDPTGKIVQVNQLTLDNNGNFQDKINTSSPLWSSGGMYTIYVQAGAQQGLLSTTTQFSLPGGAVTNNSCTPQQLSATIGSELYCIDYSIDGGTVSGVTLNTASKTLAVQMQADNDGQITLNIPRSVLDAKSGTTDSVFAVMIDGEQVQQFTESPTNDTRNITIPFQAGSEKIEIIGTQIVPEFGPIAALVLAIAIVSIIAVSAKTGLR